MHGWCTERRSQGALLAGTVGLLMLAGAALAASGDGACLVCGGALAGDTATVTYRDREHAVHAGPCCDHWNEAQEAGQLDTIVHRIEPRGALFQADAKFLNPEYQASHPLRSLWLWAGVGVLAAILSGGIAAALAIPAHRSGVGAFALGFLLPGLGIVLAGRLPVRRGEFPMRGSKIPQTHAHVACPGCGRAVHPSAAQCAGCGAALAPSLVSEVERARAGDAPRAAAETGGEPR